MKFKVELGKIRCFKDAKTKARKFGNQKPSKESIDFQKKVMEEVVQGK